MQTCPQWRWGDGHPDCAGWRPLRMTYPQGLTDPAPEGAAADEELG